MISFENDFCLFKSAGFAELIGCITIAEIQSNAAQYLTDIAREEAKVAEQEARIMREMGPSIAASNGNVWLAADR